MNVVEAAAYLTERGYPCKSGTVRALAKAGSLRGYRPGPTGRGRFSFTVAQLDGFLSQAEIAPEMMKGAKRVRRAPVSDWREALAYERSR